MMLPAELRAPRLVLRALAASDSDDLFAARGDEEVMAYWDALPDSCLTETAAVTELFLAEMRSGTSMYWAVRLSAGENFVGVCDLSEISPGESADVGFMLVRKFWGRGFGSEVVQSLLLCAKAIDLKFLTARIHSGNERSQRVLLRGGFQVIDRLRQYEIRPGVFRDCLRLSIARLAKRRYSGFRRELKGYRRWRSEANLPGLDPVAIQPYSSDN